jgi:predicted regulator of Ras-like GTPase activity (Roadblock/LC7/MglB family)
VTLREELGSALQSMRDVRGVQGSFVVSDFGRLLARDMPAMFGDDILGEAGPRALRLKETLGYGGKEVEGCTLRYTDFFVFVRPLRDGLLCVVAGTEINPAVMKMAMNLAIRRLNVLLDAPADDTVTATVSPPGHSPRRDTPASPRAAGLPASGDPSRVVRTQEIPFSGPSRTDSGDRTIVRMYRGRPVSGD